MSSPLTNHQLRIQIASDLHIEYKNNDIHDIFDFITPSADILVLAGDIGSLYKINQLKTFLQDICKHFIHVFYIPGNHEWYTVPGVQQLPMSILERRLVELENNIDNLRVLNRSSVLIGDLCIAGCTLWSKPQCEVPRFLVRINGINTRLYNHLHNVDLQYTENIINYCKDNKHRLLMITHHPPTLKALDGSKKRKKYRSLYATDLDYLLDKNNVDTWVCGHVHKNFDFVSDMGCRVIGNQKGKPKDKITDFNKNLVICF